MKTIVIASGNAHKIAEFAQLFSGLPLSIHSAALCGGMPEVVEDGASFADNAAKKAAALRPEAPRDAWVLADDSGLEVDALGGAPGLFSARYAGPKASDADNRIKLLKALEGIPLLQRKARFRCVLCLVHVSGSEQFFEGTCDGHIALESVGEAGFGYDPVFVPDGYAESFAELGDSVKAKLSHRARAAGACARWLKNVTE
jgi:XTP/dITP diphosphohydrolase